MNPTYLKESWFLWDSDASAIEFLTVNNIEFESEKPELIPIDIMGQQRMYVQGRMSSFMILTYTENDAILIKLRFGNKITRITGQFSSAYGLL